MIPLADAGASVVGVLIVVAACVGIAVSMTRGLSQRRKAQRVLHGPLGAERAQEREPGTAARISDGGQVPAQELLSALRITTAPELDAEGEPNFGPDLGLTHHEGSRHGDSAYFSADVLEGERNGHQVFIRTGNVGGRASPGIDMQRFRKITVVRVRIHPFELGDDGGLPIPKGEVPASVAGVLGDLTPSPDVWNDLRIVGGPDGIACSRAGFGDWLSGWIYDLWLLERIARRARAKPLEADNLSQDWTPPYGLGDWSPAPWSGLTEG